MYILQGFDTLRMTVLIYDSETRTYILYRKIGNDWEEIEESKSVLPMRKYPLEQCNLRFDCIEDVLKYVESKYLDLIHPKTKKRILIS